MRIAHISDLHVTTGRPIPAHRLLNKRLTGWVNLRLKRGSAHRMEKFMAPSPWPRTAKPSDTPASVSATG